jgi:uncharacterized hydrophobic protein (TIGR00271 family)
MEEAVNPDSDKHGRSIKSNMLRLFSSIRNYLHIHEEVDPDATIASIKKDADLNGYNIYILVFSIFIASIGLNVGSTAVIIGAMLISPLMGPIMGVGLSLGINDLKLLSRSLRNLGLTVTFSLLTSTLYFLISPITDLNHELMARTQPTILDALIAIFGGLAGIMASSRKEKSNAVPGVAIATALMPPLCTAGFGLASGDFGIFLGAFYLFLLNSIFISLATVVVVRYVNFPKVAFIDPKKERRVKRYITTFVVIVLLPSGVIFFNVIQESLFNQRAQTFIEKHIKSNNKIAVISSVVKYSDEGGLIELFVMGETIDEEEKTRLVAILASEGLEGASLVLRQNKADLAGLGQDLIRSNNEVLQELINEKQSTIQAQQRALDSLENAYRSSEEYQLNYSSLLREINIQYPELKAIHFAHWGVQIDTNMQRTTPTFFAKWDKKTSKKSLPDYNRKLEEWLALRLQLDSVLVVALH